MPHQRIRLTLSESNALRDALDWYLRRIAEGIICPHPHRRKYAAAVDQAIRDGGNPDCYAAPLAIVASFPGSERLTMDGDIHGLWLDTRNRAIEKVCRFSNVEPLIDGKILRVPIDTEVAL